MALSHATAIDTWIITWVEVRTTSSVALTAISRTAHHVFTERAALLDRRLQVLVRLLLDCLRVL